MRTYNIIKKLRDTAHSYWQKRISAELLFLYNLEKMGKASCTEHFEKALPLLEKALTENGAVCRQDTLLAEEILEPLSADAKKYTAHMTAHAHMDMNWMWGYQETVSATLSTIRTMLDLLKEYPDFTFSQSQASVYEIVEKYAPEMLSEIKQRINEGRFEVTAGTWVEHDKNLSGTEAQLRQVTEARKYLSSLLEIDGKSLNIDYEPDTFGFPENTPEILSHCDIKYLYHCRGTTEDIIYNWQSSSGKSVLVYRDPKWYNDDIDPYILSDMPLVTCKYGIFDMLNVYGVGNHGGGPTKADIEAIIDMQSWPLYPEIKFSTYKAFFNALEKECEKFPTVTGEQNFIFTGCYTSQSEIKKANSVLERRLYDGECISAIASVCTDHTPNAKSFEKSWQNTLFNQFHDILPGSGVRETREHAMGRFQETIALINAEELKALRKISDSCNTASLTLDADGSPFGAGVGYFASAEGGYMSTDTKGSSSNTRIIHLFNTTASERREISEIFLFDYKGDLSLISVTDSKNEPVPFTVKEHGHHYWKHYSTTLLIEAHIPPFGYETYVISQKDADGDSCFRPDVNPRVHTFGDVPIVLENDRIRAVFEPVTYALESLTDKKTGKILACDASFDIIWESLRRGESSWAVGQYMDKKSLNRDYKTKFMDYSGDSLHTYFRYAVYFENSEAEITVTLKKGSSLLDVDMDLHWLEAECHPNSVPQLSFSLKVNEAKDNFSYAVPAGCTVRPSLCHDVPSLHNIYADGLCIVCPDKYGFRGNGSTLSLTLIRSSCDPDPYPELGRHSIKFSFGAARCAEECQKMTDALCHPPIQLNATSHEGTLPCSLSFARVTGAEVVSMQPAYEKDGVILRLVCTKDTVTAEFRKEIKEACITNADLSECTPVKAVSNTVTKDTKKGAVLTLLVNFADR